MNKFNLAKFNIPSDKKPVSVKDTASISLFGTTIIQKPVKSSDRLNIALNIRKIRIIRILPNKDNANASLKIKNKIGAKVSILDNACIITKSNIKASKHIYITDSNIIGIEDNTIVSKHIYTKDTANIPLTINLNASKLISIDDTITIQLLTKSQIASIINTLTNINVTIKPGQTLRVNSENYTVYLDDVPIINLQNGEWVFIDRNIVDLQLSAGISGDIQASISYNERWL